MINKYYKDFVNLIKKRCMVIVLILIPIICITEGILHRYFDYLLISGLRHTTIIGSLGYYIHSPEWDNDLDNDIVDVEAYELVLNSYYMAGVYKKNAPGSLISAGYPPNKYRMLAAFFPSFLLKLFSLRNSWRIAVIVLWIFACYSMLFLGTYIFKSKKIGIISGLLSATSYTVIILIPGLKCEVYQLITPICLIALSVYLGHFSNDISRNSLLNSFLLGICAGICVFTGGGAFYFIPFLFFYGLLTMNFKSFFVRNLVFVSGIIIIFFLYSPFIWRPQTSSLFHFIKLRDGLHLKEFWLYFFKKYKVHMFYNVPIHFWLGAVCGLLLLKFRELKIILCIFTMLFTSEGIHLLHAWRWATTFSYYHLQIIFPVYLLNARFIYFLLFETRLSSIHFVVFIKRFVAVVFILFTLFTSNLGLLGNKYYYYESIRITPIELLFHSFFTFDNLYVYRNLNK